MSLQKTLKDDLVVAKQDIKILVVYILLLLILWFTQMVFLGVRIWEECY